jgi:hypothetical protein
VFVGICQLPVTPARILSSIYLHKHFSLDLNLSFFLSFLRIRGYKFQLIFTTLFEQVFLIDGTGWPLDVWPWVQISSEYQP